MDMIRKLITCEVKEVRPRVLEFIGSNETKDRADDIIRADGWQLKHYKENPVFMWAHDYDQPPIGKATRVWIDKESKALKFHIEFADAETYEFADTIYKLYLGGFLKASSVGFQPIDWDGKDDENPYPKWTGNIFTKQELYELSAVPVPANPEALVQARESGLITVKEFEGFSLNITTVGETVTAPPVATFDDVNKLFDNLTIEKDSSEVTREAKEVSQDTVKDELDYARTLIEEGDLSKENIDIAWDIVRETLRLPGSDIPDDIKDQFKAVLAADVEGQEKDDEPPQATEEEPSDEEEAREVAEIVAIACQELTTGGQDESN